MLNLFAAAFPRTSNLSKRDFQVRFKVFQKNLRLKLFNYRQLVVTYTYANKDFFLKVRTGRTVRTSANTVRGSLITEMNYKSLNLQMQMSEGKMVPPEQIKETFKESRNKIFKNFPIWGFPIG